MPMKAAYSVITLFVVGLLLPVTLPAVTVGPVSNAPTERQELSERQKKKMARKQARQERKMKKLRQKAQKRGYSVLDNSKFRLGAILILGGIGVGILAGLGILRGLLGFIAGLLALAGIILLVWGLLEYYG